MGTITLKATPGAVVAGYPVNGTLTIGDANFTDIVAAYQQAANTYVNGTATVTQVWQYIFASWGQALQTAVQANQTVPAVVPPPISIVPS